jgi:hypothetical protein
MGADYSKRVANYSPGVQMSPAPAKINFVLFRQFNRKLIAGCIFASALICLIVAAISFAYTRGFVSNAMQADGTVTQVIERSDSHGSFFYPVYKFDDAHGVEHTIYSSMGSYPPDHQVGDKIKVLYLPDDPGNAKIDDFISLWIIPLVTGLLAAVNFPVALVIWFWPKISRILKKSQGDVSKTAQSS